MLGSTLVKLTRTINILFFSFIFIFSTFSFEYHTHSFCFVLLLFSLIISSTLSFFSFFISITFSTKINTIDSDQPVFSPLILHFCRSNTEITVALFDINTQRFLFFNIICIDRFQLRHIFCLLLFLPF